MKQGTCTSQSYFEYPNNLFELRNSFISVCNEVLPEKIEHLYVELINQLIELEGLFYNANSNDWDVSQNNKTLRGFDLSKPNSLQQISGYLSTKSEDLSYEDLQGLSVIVENLLKQRKLYDIQQKHIKEINTLNVEKSVASGDIQEQIKQKIKLIINSYLNLQNLNMEDRLNGITISQKHIDEIMSIPNLGDSEKDALIKHLKDHTLLRIEAFKCAENFAKSIMDNFANNSLSDNLNNAKPENWDLLSESIMLDSDVFANNVILNADKLRLSSDKDAINSLYEAVINTVNGREVDITYLESLPQPITGENNYLYVGILDNIRNRQIKQNDIEQSTMRF